MTIFDHFNLYIIIEIMKNIFFNISFFLVVGFISFLVVGYRNRLQLPDSLLWPPSNLTQEDNMANNPI